MPRGFGRGGLAWHALSQPHGSTCTHPFPHCSWQPGPARAGATHNVWTRQSSMPGGQPNAGGRLKRRRIFSLAWQE